MVENGGDDRFWIRCGRFLGGGHRKGYGFDLMTLSKIR